MVRISISFQGLDETNDYLRGIQLRTPKSQENIARAAAFDVQKGARFRLTTRMRAREMSTGTLWSSIMARQIQNGEWETRFGDNVIYGPSIERGQFLSGWQFIPVQGKGRRGEGFMVRRPGAIHMIQPEFFFRDAVESTLTRLDSIIEREAGKLLGE